MQALTFVAGGHLEWRDVPAPSLQGNGEALVRPLAVATCDLDAAIVRGQVPFPGPFTLGHESVGEVTDVGDAVTSVRPGDCVVVPFQPACGQCGFCARGLTANCTKVPRTSMYGIGVAGGDWGGALADVLRVPFADAMLLKLPAGVSPAAAASAGDNIADAWRTVAPQLQRARRRPGLDSGRRRGREYSPLRREHRTGARRGSASTITTRIRDASSWPVHSERRRR